MFAGPCLNRSVSPVCLAAVLLLGSLTLAASAQDQPRPERDGLFVTVADPITDQVVTEIKTKLQAAIDKKRTLDTVVFDFNPQDAVAATMAFGAASDLAEYIRALQLGRVPGLHPKTVAFVHNSVTGHTVLPVLACGQIVMSLETDDRTQRPRAKIGDVARNAPGGLSRPQRLAYLEFAEQYASPDLIARFLEPTLPLQRVETEAGVRFMGAERIEKLKAEGKTVVARTQVPPGLEPGNALFDAEQCRTFGLCQAFYNTRSDLRKALGLSRASLNEDWLAGKQIVAWRIDVSGPLDKGRLDSLRRRINFAVGRGANFLVLNLATSAGDTTHVATLAQELRQLRDRSGSYPVKTVAYVPTGVGLGAGTYLAVGCNEIVMASDAVLADFNYLRQDPPELLRRREEMLLPLVKEQDYPELLFKATLTPGLVLYRVHSDAGDDLLVSEEQYREDQQGPKKLQSLGRIAAPPGDLLTISAALAREWRIAASATIEGPEQLYRHYGLEPDRVRVSRDDLLDRVAEFFREPLVNVILIMLGIIGLILELKLPGTTFPGALAALCFVLFFWAYSFVGEFTLLAVLLFLLGLALIGVEIFLVPGLGFSGFAGVGLIVTSLALVTLERWPETSQDWTRLGSTVTTLAFSLVGALVGAFVIAYFLPTMPYFNRLVLQPPTEEAGNAAGGVPAALLGAIGVTATPLRPAGKVQFGDDFLDVVAEGDYVSPGRRVQVIEIEANRIVVKEV